MENQSKPQLLNALSEESLLTFEQKYMKAIKSFRRLFQSGHGFPAAGYRPADVPQSVKQEVKDYAQQAFRALDCRGLVRFGFMVEQVSNKVYFNEVNVLPDHFPIIYGKRVNHAIPLPNYWISWYNRHRRTGN